MLWAMKVIFSLRFYQEYNKKILILTNLGIKGRWKRPWAILQKPGFIFQVICAAPWVGSLLTAVNL